MVGGKLSRYAFVYFRIDIENFLCHIGRDGKYAKYQCDRCAAQSFAAYQRAQHPVYESRAAKGDEGIETADIAPGKKRANLRNEQEIA